MRIMILTPTALPAITGNAMTVERWRRSLVSKEGCQVSVVESTALSGSKLKNEIDSFKPDVIHVHHVVRSGGVLRGFYYDDVYCRVPLVVSPSGTDIYMDFDDNEKRAVAEDVFNMAMCVIVQNNDTLQRVIEIMPDLKKRVKYVPKSFMWLGSMPFDLRKNARLEPDSFVFFMPANIRPVKGNLECLHMLAETHKRRPMIRAVFSGAVLDPVYGERFKKELVRHKDFACLLPPIAPEKIYSAYMGVDVVVNGSFSEGLSNVLIEAKAAGKPVLASNISANILPVTGDDGKSISGLLFNHGNCEDFIEKAIELFDNKGLRDRLSRAGKKNVSLLPAPEEEASLLAGVYRKAKSNN